MTINGGSRAVRVGSLVRRARRGGREVSFVVLAHQDREKRKKKNGKHGCCTFPTSPSVIAHLRLAQLRFATGTLVRRGDLPPVREVLVRPPLPTPRGDLIVVRDSVLVQERAPRHRAVPRAPSGRTKINGSRFCDDEETRPRVRERSRTRLSSSGRFRGATRFRRLAREASTAARSPVSAGDSARARRRRARLGLDEVSRGMGKRVPSEESSNQRAENLRANFALWSMFSRFGLSGASDSVNNSCRDLWDHRPTRASAVFPFFSGAPKRRVRTRG